ncbi:EAL domain-containing protein [Vibrio sp. SM6]|uniref:EAL domain-containing protein n=1 Tax=Vibrio agarilyticus TaxID=2726741 RepID=A0A7X8TRJ6_9VIBR|nr:GGDEF and EAL domain-containing protein [Vibrio agarilyticus]NLS13321.1 EAL domain-containing protein [Vibrio agarilyticus]
MTSLKHHDVPIPETLLNSWQHIVDQLASELGVAAALVMRAHANSIEVCCASDTQNSPYHRGEHESWQQNLYCETVLRQGSLLCIENAEATRKWANNPDLKLGMKAYCGLPLRWPTGESFGTLCLLDDKNNPFCALCRHMLEHYQTIIETELASLCEQEKLQRLNHELRHRVESRTLDLANISYSLNQEIERRKSIEQQMHYQRDHDSGTGFLNRKALEHQIEQMLQKAKRTQKQVAVIHIGIANARGLQTKFGFDQFEVLLKQYRDKLGQLDLSECLTARPCTNDIVLAFITENVSRDCDALLIRILDAGRSDYFLQGEEVHLHSHIGVASSSSATALALLRHANQAMVVCKDSGERFTFYLQSHSDHFVHHNQIESYLLQAVRNDDLLLYFQPKVTPQTRHWVGAEALLRWRHPILGDISNEALIHMAEQNGLIFEVGAFVLRAAVEKAKEWQTCCSEFRIAVNVSPIQLKNPRFCQQVKHLLEIYHLPPRCLELEVTESGLIADEVLARETLNQLSKLGVALSLDDFGTGYASFSYLKKYPFDAIKIDKSFVQHLDDSEQDREIIRSIIHVAKKLELIVVVEGIETESQERLLIHEGCDFGQGYLYGKPMPANEFEINLQQHAAPEIRSRRIT